MELLLELLINYNQITSIQIRTTRQQRQNTPDHTTHNIKLNIYLWSAKQIIKTNRNVQNH